LNVHEIKDVRQSETCTEEPLVLVPIPFEVKIATQTSEKVHISKY